MSTQAQKDRNKRKREKLHNNRQNGAALEQGWFFYAQWGPKEVHFHGVFYRHDEPITSEDPTSFPVWEEMNHDFVVQTCGLFDCGPDDFYVKSIKATRTRKGQIFF
jgi:hypothetical protein